MCLSNVYNRDMRGCDTIEFIEWKSANWTMEELKLPTDKYPLTNKGPHKPANLSPEEDKAYIEIYQYYFFWLCDAAKQYWDTKNIGSSEAA